MSELPKNLKYAKSHEWSKRVEDDLIHVGITDFAQEELGDLVYIDLPEVGKQFKAGEQCAVVESVKTASDLYSPVTGTIVAVNEDILEAPEQVNDDPYDAWLFCIRADTIAELDNLMDATAYQAMIKD